MHITITHKNADGKTACKLAPKEKTVEIAHKNFRVLIRFNPDGTADAVNYFPDGTSQTTKYK